MKAITIAAICLVSTGLSGCIIVNKDHHGWSEHESWRDQQSVNNNAINQLALDSSRQEVTELLGRPDFSEAIKRDEDSIYFLYYRTHRVKSDGETSKDETTPLVFVNDRLIGWGDEAAAEYSNNRH